MFDDKKEGVLEMTYDIGKLLELSKTCRKTGYMLTDARYAIKKAKYDMYAIQKDKYLICTSPKVERTITIYGEDLEDLEELEDIIVKVEYSLPDFTMFDSRAIKDAGLIPLHPKSIPNYFEITDTVIIHKKNHETKVTNIKHENTNYYKYNHHLVDLDKSLRSRD